MNHENIDTISKIEDTCDDSDYSSVERRKKHYLQQSWEIIRLVDCNYTNATKFVTLTFRDNVKDIEFANKEFKKFIQRLNYRLAKKKRVSYYSVPYLATWEIQKRGSIHYHVLFFSLGFIRNKELREIWRNGFIKINQVNVDSKDNRGRYLVKYFTKSLEEKEKYKKAFFKSRNLKTPVIRKSNTTQAFDFTNKIIVYSTDYIRYIPDFTDDSPNNMNGKQPMKFRNGTVHYKKVLKE